MLKELFRRKRVELADVRETDPAVVAEKFMRIAKEDGVEFASSYLGWQRADTGHRAVAIILAELSKAQQVKA